MRYFLGAIVVLAVIQLIPAQSNAELVFGSYGRVGVGSNFDGRGAQTIRVTRHGPRIEERPYAEVDFAYHQREGTPFETHLTLGLGNHSSTPVESLTPILRFEIFTSNGKTSS